MRARVWSPVVVVLVVLVAAALPVAAHRSRSDQDFEFDDDAEMSPTAAAAAGGAHSRRPRRYLYDPHSPSCRALACKKREVCLLREPAPLAPLAPHAPPRALCAYKKDILRRGDTIVAATGDEWDNAAERDDRDDEDVFYEGDGGDGEGEGESGDARSGRRGRPRCVGCGVRARGQFLCGSDNRTYSSLCRLDLHNCVRRPAPAPVRLACRGFCPCAAPVAQAAPRRPHHRSRPHATRYYDDDWRRRKLESSHNEVLPERTTRRRLSQSQGYEGCALDKMANRLLDWFSVVMEEAGARPPDEDLEGVGVGGRREGFPPDCKPEVRWMFAHLDTDADGMLSADNLYALRHDDRERCLRPFLASCGASAGAGAGAGVSRAAWCGCLRRAARPCTALARAHAAAAAASGAYVPACDARGYYRPRQCHAALAVCWCVDAHGVEVPGSRTKGAPACPGDAADPADPREGAPADDEDGTFGSGDAELRF